MEPQAKNDLFFTCSLIEYIARKTKNKKKDIVLALTRKNIQKIYDLAEVYHCENIDKITDEFIEECNIKMGSYDVIANTIERVPSYFEIGRVYQRLIVMVNSDESLYVSTLIEVMTSWIIEHIDNYNSSMYYENPDYIYQCYVNNVIL